MERAVVCCVARKGWGDDVCAHARGEEEREGLCVCVCVFSSVALCCVCGVISAVRLVAEERRRSVCV